MILVFALLDTCARFVPVACKLALLSLFAAPPMHKKPGPHPPRSYPHPPPLMKFYHPISDRSRKDAS
eukprot:755991-Hanusia_phi.AAC.3